MKVKHFQFSPIQCLTLFCIIFVPYIYVHQGGGWNQNSRLDVLHSLWNHGTVSIDTYHRNTGDKALFEGHYYSTKAPGIVFMGLPAFVGSAHLLQKLGYSIDEKIGWRYSHWITVAGSVALLAAVGGVALFFLLSTFVSARSALVTTLAIYLGSIPFPYGTAFFSHAAVTGLLSIALWSALLWKDRNHDLLAGMACGFAVASEYPAIFVVLGLLVFIASKSLRRALFICLGALPAALLVLGHSSAVFGSPFVTGYSYTVHASAKNGLLNMPDLSAIPLLLFSPSKGLFFWTPVSLLSLLGYYVMHDRDRSLRLLTIFVPVVYLLFIISFANPGGGFTIGPRYFGPILPFLAIPIAFGVQKLPRFGTLLAALSIILTGAGTLVTATPPSSVKHLLVEYYLPKIWSARYAINLGKLFGLEGHWSVLPLLILVIVLSVFLWRSLPKHS